MNGADWAQFGAVLALAALAGGFLWYVTQAPGADEKVHTEECSLFLHLGPFNKQIGEWIAERPTRTPAFKVWEGDHPNCEVEINGVMYFDWPHRTLIWEAQAREGTDLAQALDHVGLPLVGLFLSPVNLKAQFVSFTATFELPE